MPNDSKFEATPEQAKGMLFDPDSPPVKPKAKIPDTDSVVESASSGLDPDVDAEFDRLDAQGQFNTRIIETKTGERKVEFGRSKKTPRARRKRTDLTKDGTRVRINSLSRRSQLFAEVPDEENLR